MDDAIGKDQVLVPTNLEAAPPMAAQPQRTEPDSYALPSLRLTETIDGVVKGIVISDDITHLYVQEVCGAEIKLIVEYSELAQAITPHLQKGVRPNPRGRYLGALARWLASAERRVLRTLLHAVEDHCTRRHP